VNPLLKNHLVEIEVLCQNYQVKSLYASGKVCEEDVSGEQEIDLLVDFNGLPKEMEIERSYKMTYLLEEVFQHKVELIRWNNAEYLGVLNEESFSKILLFKK